MRTSVLEAPPPRPRLILRRSPYLDVPRASGRDHPAGSAGALLLRVPGVDDLADQTAVSTESIADPSSTDAPDASSGTETTRAGEATAGSAKLATSAPSGLGSEPAAPPVEGTSPAAPAGGAAQPSAQGPAQSGAAPLGGPAMQGPAAAQCSNCGAVLASDQRYCLECGARRVPTSSFLLAASAPAGVTAPSPPPTPPPLTPPGYGAESAATRSGWLGVIAFVGVLLLAMGVGVLIGRAGNSKPSSSPQVITVNSGGSGGDSTEAAFTGSWPSGTSGYTVELQSLPASGTRLSAVESAKSSATGKGAKEVGALKSEEFSSLPSGSYIIYSGVFNKRAEAVKALSALKGKFAGASVIHVAEGSGASGAAGKGAGSGSSSGGSSGGVGSSPTKPAPPSVLKNLHKAKGKSYEERSKALPDVVETG